MATSHNAVANRKAIEAYKATYEMITTEKIRTFNKAAITQNMLTYDKATKAELSGAPLRAFLYVQMGHDVDTIMEKLGHDRDAGKPVNNVKHERLGISPNGKVFDAVAAYEAGLIDEDEMELAEKKYIKRMKAQARIDKDEDNEPVKKVTKKKVVKRVTKEVKPVKKAGAGKKKAPTKEAIKILAKKFNSKK